MTVDTSSPRLLALVERLAQPATGDVVETLAQGMKRARKMHRRAQKAEGQLAIAAYWLGVIEYYGKKGGDHAMTVFAEKGLAPIRAEAKRLREGEKPNV